LAELSMMLPYIPICRGLLLEETGWRPAPLTELVSYNALSGISDMRFTAYPACGATYIGEPIDPSESRRVEWLPLGEVPRLVRDGMISDGPSLTALAYYRATGP
jgi:hypothetical protein